MRTLSRMASDEALHPIEPDIVVPRWWVNIELLKRIMPGLVAMNPMTAVGFICLGLALAFHIRGRSRIGETLAWIALGSELGQGFYFGEPLSDDTLDGMPMLLRK